MYKFWRDADHKFWVLQHADKISDVGKACHYLASVVLVSIVGGPPVGSTVWQAWRTAKQAKESRQSYCSRDRREGAAPTLDIPLGANSHSL